MLHDDANFGYEEDRQHLQGLSPHFASKVDLLLCVQEGSQETAFPVHEMIVSAHSSVLSHVFEDTSATVTKPRDSKLARVPMMDDSCSAVRSALTCMYACFPLTPSTALQSDNSFGCNLSLDSMPTHTSHMKFYDKYNMTKIAEMQTEAFMTPLQSCLMADSLDTEAVAHVLDCAAAATKCELLAMLAVCEDIITRHFDVFMCQHSLMASKLSSCSMLKVAQAKLEEKEAIIKDMHAALTHSVAEAKRFNICTIKSLRGSSRQHDLSCPRCSSKLRIENYNDILEHDKGCTCKLACTWPELPRGGSSYVV